jgi:molybdate transport system substrate-binding protein
MMKIRAIATVLCGLFVLSEAAQCAEVAVLASGAVKEIVTELLPTFEKASRHKLTITWSGTANIEKQIAGGEVYDLVIVGAPQIDAFVKDGKVKSGTRVDLVRSGVGVAVKKGAPKPDISSAAALKKALLDAKSVAYSTGPSGSYVLTMFDKLGIGAEMKPKSIQTATGTRVGDYLGRGEAEIGFQQIAELIHETGSDYVGPLPPEIQNVTVFSSGIHTAAKQSDAAKMLQAFLASSEATPVIRKNGMEPAK